MCGFYLRIFYDNQSKIGIKLAEDKSIRDGICKKNRTAPKGLSRYLLKGNEKKLSGFKNQSARLHAQRCV